MLKIEELSNLSSCLNKAATDEPVFVLRAKDPVAAMAIRHWATMATGVHEKDKVDQAREIANLMEEYRGLHFPPKPQTRL